MDSATIITEHMADSSGIRISILPFMLFISIVVFVACVVLQIICSKKRTSYVGYIGCSLELLLSIVLVLLFNSDVQGYMREGEKIMNSILVFLLFNIPTILLLIITLLTNKKHKQRISEL